MRSGVPLKARLRAAGALWPIHIEEGHIWGQTAPLCVHEQSVERCGLEADLVLDFVDSNGSLRAAISERVRFCGFGEFSSFSSAPSSSAPSSSSTSKANPPAAAIYYNNLSLSLLVSANLKRLVTGRDPNF